MASFTFQLDDSEKSRLQDLAATKSRDSLGTVSMGALACVALREYLDREEQMGRPAPPRSPPYPMGGA